MSGRKNTLAVFHNINAGDMSGNITSPATNIEFLDNIGIQFNFTGSPVGTFAVQVSADHVQDFQGNVIVAGNWVSIPLSPSPAATGSANQIYVDLNQLSAPYVRFTYTFTSGTGFLNSYIVGKAV